MAQLLIAQDEERRTFELREDRTCTIGRSRDTDVHLDDLSLSRKHCEVCYANGVWLLRDLGSVNGTFCNNAPVAEHTLRAGDRIQLGRTTITFLEPEVRVTTAAVFEATASGVDFDVARRMRNFMTLLDITKAVNSVLSKDRLLEMIIDAAIELTNADRGFLVLFEKGESQFKVARDRKKGTIDQPELKTSRTVIATVARTGEPILTMDAQTDLGAMSDTITNLDVRSLLCAPLKVKDKVIGCVYVDSQIADVEFSAEALNLLQAFADQAAIAVENARLYDEAMASREQEKRVRQVFQKYVPADVVRRALEISDNKRMSTKQTATVLFSDIRGFTSISERMEPEDVVTFLNDYLQRMVSIVFEEGGIVDKFIGDAVMAVFGAPFPKPDDAMRAVRAATRMLTELDRFNEDQAAKDQVQIRIGVGVHTGPVIAGNIGSDRKMEYTVIGDTVNIASRVQDLTKEFGVPIIITQACLDATRRRVPVRALPPVHVKGKELALQVYEVLRTLPAEQDTTTAGALDSPTLPRTPSPRRPLAAPPLGPGRSAGPPGPGVPMPAPRAARAPGANPPTQQQQERTLAREAKPPSDPMPRLNEDTATGLDGPTLPRPMPRRPPRP